MKKKLLKRINNSYGESLYKKGKHISDLFPQKCLSTEVPAVNHKDLIKHHNILSIPLCSLVLICMKSNV